MKKSLLIFLVAFLFCMTDLMGQSMPNWTWGVALGTDSYDYVNGMTVDKSGNSYIYGEVYGTKLYGGLSYQSTDTFQGNRLFVAKISAAGQVQWTRDLYLASQQYGLQINNIMVDDNSNVYLGLGEYSESYQADTMMVIVDGKTEFSLIGGGQGMGAQAVLKFDLAGNLVYGVPIRGISYNYGYVNIGDATIDAQGNLFLAGEYSSDTLMIGNKIVSQMTNYNNLFVAKLNPSGITQWLVQDSTDQPQGNGVTATKIVLDKSGNPLVYGNYDNPDRKIGGNIINNNSAGTNDLFLISLSAATGAPLFLRGYGDSGDDVASSMSIDHTGNIYITGSSNSGNLFSQYMVEVNYGLFMAKLTPTGDFIWDHNIDAGNYYYSYKDDIQALIGSNDYPVMTGTFYNSSISVGALYDYNHGDASTNDFFLVRFDSDGNPLWLHTAGVQSYENQTFAFMDRHDKVTTTSYMSSDYFTYKDTVFYPAEGGMPGFVVARYDSLGNVSDQGYFPGGSDSYTMNYAAHSPSGLLYYTGSFYSATATFGNSTITSIDGGGYGDIFVSQLGYSVLGHVYDKDGQPVSNGYAEMFLLGNNTAAQLIDSARVSRGIFSFNNAPLNNFIIYAGVDTNVYHNYVGTYDGNVTLWSKASVIDQDTSNASIYNISMVQLLPTTGPGSIKGNVTSDDNGISKAIMARVVKGASVVLVGKASKGTDTVVIAITQTDEFGGYEFDNVPLGSFQVYVDVPGLGMKEYYSVNITTQQPDVDEINYILKPTGVYKDISAGVINVKNSSSSGLSVYPNPANEYIYVNVPWKENAPAYFDVFDISGRLVMKYFSQSTLTPVSLPVETLHSGLYLLRVSTSDRPSGYARFIKQ